MFCNLHSILIILLFLVVSCKESGTTTATQFDVSILSAEGQEAYRDIDTAKRFCSESESVAGHAASVIFSYRDLIKEEYADAAFKSLLSNATTAGKLYALCGIYYTDSAYFRQAVQPFRTSDDIVATCTFGAVTHESVRSVVESNIPNTVRLSNRDETIVEWLDRSSGSTVNFDIIGGGFPNMFKESGGFEY